MLMLQVIDSLTALDLNPSDSVKIQILTLGDITVPTTGSDIIRNSGDANDTLRVRDTQGVWEFRNRNLRCMNPSNPANWNGDDITRYRRGL